MFASAYAVALGSGEREVGRLTGLESGSSCPIRGDLCSIDRFQRSGRGNRDLVGRFLRVGGRNESHLGNLLCGMSGSGVPPSRPPVCEQVGRARVTLRFRHGPKSNNEVDTPDR